MIAGHYGLAAGVKRWAPRLPLWALMLSTFLLDVVFIVFNIAGIEYLTPVDPAHPDSYGNALIHAYYTHSLVGALLIAAIAGWLASRRWDQRGGIAIATVVFSHWVLDLLVHRPDLPLLPGNVGNLPLLGFGLWPMPATGTGARGGPPPPSHWKRNGRPSPRHCLGCPHELRHAPPARRGPACLQPSFRALVLPQTNDGRRPPREGVMTTLFASNCGEKRKRWMVGTGKHYIQGCVWRSC